MIVNVYIDVLFFWQFILIMVVVDISCQILKWKRSVARMVVSAVSVSFVNTGYYAYILVKHLTQGNEAILLMFGEMVILPFFLGSNKKIMQIIKSTVVLTLVSFSIAGGWCAIHNVTKTQDVIWILIYAVSLDALFQSGYGMITKEQIYQNCICDVEIFIQDKIIKAKGYYDSGNCLTEPYGQTPVVIVSEALLKKNQIHCEQKLMVPYYSLGNNEGLIGAIIADYLCIEGRKMFYKVYLAIDNDVFVKQKSYDLILHSSMI